MSRRPRHVTSPKSRSPRHNNLAQSPLCVWDLYKNSQTDRVGQRPCSNCARIFYSIFASGKVPHVHLDAPHVHSDAPDNRQETPEDPQETFDNPQDTCQVLQELYKMTEFSGRNLTFDKEADIHLLDHFCKRGTLEKDPAKPGKPALFGHLLKYMVASDSLDIERIEEGVPIFSRGRAHVAHTGHVQPSALQETNNNLRVASNEFSQTQQAHLQQTPLQLAHANARSAKMAYKKATRIAQEKTQEAAQEVNRIKQEVTADSRKAKKAERYRATMEKLGKLPPCPKLCRGRECEGIPCEEEEPGFPYSHIDDMVVCHDKLHMSMATRDGCFLFHMWPARKTKPPAKNSAGEPRARGTSPQATAATRRLGNRGMPTALGTGPSISSSSDSSSLKGSSSSSGSSSGSSSSSNNNASTTRERSRS
jgi:hypothetical protein